MFELRPLWGLIVFLNVCVVIWQIQEPAMPGVEFDGSAQNVIDGYAPAPAPLRQQQQQQQQQQQRQHPQQPDWPSWPNGIGVRNSIVEEQLYAGKHLLADTAEANEIAAKVTRQADDSLLHNSGYSSHSSTSTKRKGTQLIKNYASSLSVTTVKSTPSPLVTAATLKYAADIQTTTTGNVRTSHNFPPDDFHQLIDLHDFTYLISQGDCSRDIQALILVHSAPANEEKRRLIRETWGNTDILPRVHGVMPLRIVFLLGRVNTKAQQLGIERENFVNGDIVQGSFVDTYRNMTYKHVMALKWFLYNCAHAQILLKVDDDIYINTPQLLIYLERARLNGDWGSKGIPVNKATAASSVPQHTADTASNAVASNSIENRSSNSKSSSSSNLSSSRKNVQNASDFKAIGQTSNTTQLNAAQMLFQHPHDLLLCKKTINAKVKRSYRSKWRVSTREFSDTYYPPYCPGFSIVYSPDVVLALYNAAQLSTYFWIDDVHITGVLAQNISITITNINELILYEADYNHLLNGVVQSDDMDFICAWHLIKPKQWQNLWELYLAKARRHLSPAPASTLSQIHAAKKTPHKTTEFNKFKSYR